MRRSISSVESPSTSREASGVPSVLLLVSVSNGMIVLIAAHHPLELSQSGELKRPKHHRGLSPGGFLDLYDYDRGPADQSGRETGSAAEYSDVVQRVSLERLSASALTNRLTASVHALGVAIIHG